jgi:putative transposase
MRDKEQGGVPLAPGGPMTRVPRWQQRADGGYYHLMDRGHDRAAIFADDEDRRAFLALLGRYRERFGFRLHHYCLMTNHFHLLVQLRRPRDLSPLMAGLLRAYVHPCHRRHGFVGHRWQGRFKSPAVQRDGYLRSCGRYIERNPLAAGLVAEPWAYRWSSCRAYALGEADALVSASPGYLELAEAPARRQQLWRDFLLGADPREEAVRRGDWAVGDEDFRRRQRQQQGRPGYGRRGRPPKAAAARLAEGINTQAQGATEHP